MGAVVQSSLACDNAWRRLTARRFSFNDRACIRCARRFSSSARTVIEGIATAATPVATTRGEGNAAGPTSGTNRARKGSSITATVNANTGSDAGKNSLA
jgi:hypothetical protein